MNKKILIWFCIIWVFFILNWITFSQNYLTQPAKVIIVQNNTWINEKPPIIIFMPATNYSSSDFFTSIKDIQPFQNYIAVLPEWKPLRNEYEKNFNNFSKLFESNLLKNLDTINENFQVDTWKVYIEGMSLWWDLARSILMRRKTRFKWVTIIGSRISYPITKRDCLELINTPKNIILTIWYADSSWRIDWMKKQESQLQKCGILSNIQYFSGWHILPKKEFLQPLLLQMK